MKCNGDSIVRKNNYCETNFNVKCDNNIILGYNYGFYQNASDQCKKEGSFIKWYPNNFCSQETPLPHPFWTNVRRYNHTFYLKKSENIQDQQLQSCFRLHRKNKTQEKSTKNCSRRFKFFCRFGTNKDDGETIFIPNISPKTGEPNDTAASVIGGTVSAVLIIALIGVTALFLYKRRKTSKEPHMKTIGDGDRSVNVHAHTKENDSDEQYHEIDINTVDYSLAKPLSSNQKLANKTEGETNEYTRIVSSTFQIHNEANKTHNAISNLGYNDMKSEDRNNQSNARTIPEFDKTNVSNYALAKPITDTDELDLYTANTDYDHLNSVTKQEMSDMKVYDHLKNATESDPTYDHAGVTVREDTKNYEHFNIEK
ncbi:uncharacterized protein LOC143054263 [Mytilus galloprovincialis]|uniref:uncharacterized protein LOC143054263 n=1 Tax=Mytilus galloprovincialis TaxID=29158 RepID=UPI003F7B43B9